MLDILHAAAGQPGGQPNSIMSFAPFFSNHSDYVFFDDPSTAKETKEKQNMLDNLKTGDEILTIGGIYGKIEGINEKDNRLIVSIGKDVKVNLARSAIADKVNK